MARAIRVLVLAAGLAAAAYGGILLLDQGGRNLVATLRWLIGGVVLHDGVLAPLTILVAVVTARLLRGRLPAAVVVGAIVLGSVTVVAVPVLGRFGARADNPTLLDRHYLLGWLVFAILTVIATTLAALAGRRRQGG
jgi:hypothetical protein